MRGLVLKELVVLRHEEVNLRRPFSKKYYDNTLCRYMITSGIKLSWNLTQPSRKLYQ